VRVLILVRPYSIVPFPFLRRALLGPTFPNLKRGFAEVFFRLPAIVLRGIAFPMDIIIFLSFPFSISHYPVNLVFMSCIVVRGRCREPWSWSKVKLYSGDIDRRMRWRLGWTLERHCIRSNLRDLERSVRNRSELSLLALLPFQQYPIPFLDQRGGHSLLVRAPALDLLRVVYRVSGCFLQPPQIVYLMLGMWVADWLMPSNSGGVVTIIQIEGCLTCR